MKEIELKYLYKNKKGFSVDDINKQNFLDKDKILIKLNNNTNLRKFELGTFITVDKKIFYQIGNLGEKRKKISETSIIGIREKLREEIRGFSVLMQALGIKSNDNNKKNKKEIISNNKNFKKDFPNENYEIEKREIVIGNLPFAEVKQLNFIDEKESGFINSIKNLFSGKSEIIKVVSKGYEKIFNDFYRKRNSEIYFLGKSNPDFALQKIYGVSEIENGIQSDIKLFILKLENQKYELVRYNVNKEFEKLGTFDGEIKKYDSGTGIFYIIKTEKYGKFHYKIFNQFGGEIFNDNGKNFNSDSTFQTMYFSKNNGEIKIEFFIDWPFYSGYDPDIEIKRQVRKNSPEGQPVATFYPESQLKARMY